MHYTNQVYRPPREAETVLLQVTVGCSHNKCRFCNSYKDISFHVEPMEQIEEDLREVRCFYPEADRIYLLHGDAFTLSYEKLKTLAEKIHSYLPNIQTISCMACISNIKGKSVEQLKELRTMGYNELYIGTESGNDEALAIAEKGHTSQEALEQLQKLDEAGFSYLCFYMLGLAGAGKGKENAVATANLFNQTHVRKIGITSLTVLDGAPVKHDIAEGRFVEASELERTIELKTFIEHLNIVCGVESTHITNGIPMSGHLPEEKDKMLSELQWSIDHFDEANMRRRRESLHSV